MEFCVGVLPISPRRGAELGFYSIPLLADLVARFSDQKFVLPINVIGSKQADEELCAKHIFSLKEFNINPAIIWRDDHSRARDLAKEVILRGLSEGWILFSKRWIFRCDCGRVEFLDCPENFLSGKFQRKTYEIDGNLARCFLCGGQAIAKEEECVLLCLSGGKVYFPSFFPDYLALEYEELVSSFAGREILISRQTGHGVEINLSGKKLTLDPDFCWMLFLPGLMELGASLDVLVFGHKTIKQAVLAIWLANLLGVPLPRILIATPYLNIDFGDKPKMKADEILSAYGAMVARCFLGLCWGSKRKDMVISSKNFYLIQHSIRMPDEYFSGQRFLSRDVIRLCEEYSQQKTLNLLSRLRGNREDLGVQDKLFLKSLIGV